MALGLRLLDVILREGIITYSGVRFDSGHSDVRQNLYVFSHTPFLVQLSFSRRHFVKLAQKSREQRAIFDWLNVHNTCLTNAHTSNVVSLPTLKTLLKK